MYVLMLNGMLALTYSVSAQEYYRVEAEFSIKEALSDSLARLTMGKVYYDKHIRKLIYKVKFPESQVWVMEDSFYHTKTPDTLISLEIPPAMVDMSVFNLVLTDELNNYGLKDSLYFRASVEKRDGMIISTWKPHPDLAHITGDILVSRKGKLLHGVVFLDAQGDVVSKQFFRKYEMSSGLPFPTEIIQILYREDTEIHRVTSFRNIRFNVADEEDHYSYSLRD